MTGIAARVAMRVVADGLPDTPPRTPAFTLEGTVGIIVLAMIAGAPLGIVYATTRTALRGSSLARGASFGVILLGIAGPLFFYGTPLEFGYPDTHLARVSLFAALFVIFGSTMGIAFPAAQRLARWLPPPGRALFALIALAGGALLAVGFVALGGEVTRTYGGATLRLLAPWAALAIAFVFAIRSRRADVGAMTGT